MTEKKAVDKKKRRRSDSLDRQEKAREAKAQECRHPHKLWHIDVNRKGAYYYECKCGAFMGFR